MTAPVNGLGAMQEAVLDGLAQLGAGPDRPTVKSSAVIRLVEQQHGIPPRYIYETLVRLADPWRTHLLLVQPKGNFGGPDDPPAAPRYTEARLSPLGAVALRLEHDDGVAMPFGLIEGNWSLDGTRPPFDPGRVLDAVASVVRAPDLADEEIWSRVGAPAFPNGCLVDGDIEGLHRGESVELELTARLSVGEVDGRATVSISSIPPLARPADVAWAVKARVAPRDPAPQNPQLAATRIAIDDLQVESGTRHRVGGAGTSERLEARDRITLRVAVGADPDRVVDQLLTVYGIRLSFFRAQLHAPIADTIRASAVGPSPERVLNAIEDLQQLLC